MSLKNVKALPLKDTCVHVRKTKNVPTQMLPRSTAGGRPNGWAGGEASIGGMSGASRGPSGGS